MDHTGGRALTAICCRANLEFCLLSHLHSYSSLWLRQCVNDRNHSNDSILVFFYVAPPYAKILYYIYIRIPIDTIESNDYFWSYLCKRWWIMCKKCTSGWFLSKLKQYFYLDETVGLVGNINFYRSMAGADGKRSLSELQTGPVEPWSQVIWIFPRAQSLFVSFPGGKTWRSAAGGLRDGKPLR